MEDTKSWYKTVAVKIEQEVSDKVREFKNEHKLKSVHIVEDTKDITLQQSCFG